MLAWLLSNFAVVVASARCARSVAPIVDDATRFKAWLKEGMGGMSAPADAVAAEWQTLWDDGEISASDMPVMDHALTKDELREI